MPVNVALEYCCPHSEKACVRELLLKDLETKGRLQRCGKKWPRALSQNRSSCCSPLTRPEPSQWSCVFSSLQGQWRSPTLSSKLCAPVRLHLRVSGSLSPRTFLGCRVTCFFLFFVVVTGFFWFVFVFPIVGLVLKSRNARLSTTQSPFWKHSELCQRPCRRPWLRSSGQGLRLSCPESFLGKF